MILHVRGVRGSVRSDPLAHALLFPSLPPRSQLFHRSYSNKHTYNWVTVVPPVLLDLHGDHVSTCTAHSGANKAHDWMVSILGPLFRTAGHQVRTQFGVSPSDPARQKRGDVEIVSYLQDAAGARNLVFDLRITHDRYGKSAQPHHNGQLTHPNDLDAPLRLAAKSKIDDYREQYANNQNISFLPAITSTSTRMHGEFLRLLFLQAHRETTAHFTALGMPAQQHCDSFRYRRAAFYNGLKSKVGLAAAKAAALRVNLNTT